MKLKSLVAMLSALIGLTVIPVGGAGQEAKKGQWGVQNSGVKEDLSAVTFIAEKIGVAVGQDLTVLKTVDGGKTWRRVVEPKKGTHLDRILFSSPKERWAVDSYDPNHWPFFASWPAPPPESLSGRSG